LWNIFRIINGRGFLAFHFAFPRVCTKDFHLRDPKANIFINFQLADKKKYKKTKFAREGKRENVKKNHLSCFVLFFYSFLLPSIPPLNSQSTCALRAYHIRLTVFFSCININFVQYTRYVANQIKPQPRELFSIRVCTFCLHRTWQKRINLN
jgi:hypothetical protein